MKEMTGNGLDGFPKDKSHITYPIALCAKMRTSMDKERAVDAIYLPFSQVFDAGGPGQEPAASPGSGYSRWHRDGDRSLPPMGTGCPGRLGGLHPWGA